MKKTIVLILGLVFVACSKNPPQYPTTYSNDGFMEYSKKRAKEQRELEALMIKDYIAVHDEDFVLNDAGFYMSNISGKNQRTVQDNDTISYTYQVSDLKNNLIYSFEEIGKKKEVMSKSRMIRGIEYGLKNLAEKGESILLIPSSLAYGKTGDENKIHGDQPLKIELKLIDIHNEQ